MRQRSKIFLLFVAACFAVNALAGDVCDICGKPIDGTVYIVTDQVTGEKKLVCSDCIKLPRCFVCGLPVKNGGQQLLDGRWLCARDAQTAVLDADDARRMADEVRDELDRLFARYTSFPENVDVNVIDRIDVDAMFQPVGFNAESPNLLGCIKSQFISGQKRYAMSLLSGLPRVELKATIAHELSHAWVGENVSGDRHQNISRDTEEGFCEMVAWLLMDSENEEPEKSAILRNHYTRGQVQLFIEAEQHYGFDEILDWMKYGINGRLAEGHLDEIRDIKIPAADQTSSARPFVRQNVEVAAVTNLPAPSEISLRLQGILWGKPPAAIINGHSVFANDQFKITNGGTEETIRCMEIQTNYVRVENLNSGQQQELRF